MLHISGLIYYIFFLILSFEDDLDTQHSPFSQLFSQLAMPPMDAMKLVVNKRGHARTKSTKSTIEVMKLVKARTWKAGVMKESRAVTNDVPSLVSASFPLLIPHDGIPSLLNKTIGAQDLGYLIKLQIK